MASNDCNYSNAWMVFSKDDKIKIKPMSTLHKKIA